MQKSNLELSSGKLQVGPEWQFCWMTGGSMVDSPPQYLVMTE